MRRGVGAGAAAHALFYVTLLLQARLCFNFMLAPSTTAHSQCRLFSSYFQGSDEDAMGGSQVPRSEIPDRFDTCLVFMSGVIGTEPSERYLSNGHYVLNFAVSFCVMLDDRSLLHCSISLAAATALPPVAVLLPSPLLQLL